jgi:hypothetical protein
MLIEQTLLKLSLQMNMLSGSKPDMPCLAARDTSLEAGLNMFLTVEEAREYLDKLMARAMQLTSAMQEANTARKSVDQLGVQQQHLRLDLETWLRTYTYAHFELDPTLPPLSRAATIVLKMYYTMTVIMTEVCQPGLSEMLYDEQTPRFIRILKDATKMWKAVTASHKQSGYRFPGDMQASIVDVGWISVVYFTAIKCRVPEVRLYAVQLLESTHHTEGMWNSSMTAMAARAVMRLESMDQDGGITEFDGILPVEGLSMPAVPEVERLHEVEMVFFDDEPGKLGLRYRTGQKNGRWKMIYQEYDPVFARWTNASVLQSNVALVSS